MEKEFNNFKLDNNSEEQRKEEKESSEDVYNQHLKSYETIQEVDRVNNGKELNEEEILSFKEKIKSTPEYQNYENQSIKINTLEDMTKKVEATLKDLKSEEEYKEKALEIFDNVVTDLKSKVEKYRRNILNMERLNRSPSGFRMEPFEKREKMEKLDRQRRNNHNVIQDHLRMISRFPEVVNEKIGTDLKWDNFFSSNEIEDREFVKRWAYTTAIGERMKKILEKIEKKKQAA